MSQPYRPCNGDEGLWFESQWCEKCQHDAAYRANPDHADACKIWTNAMAFDLNDDEYPMELICDDEGWPGNPRCTAFEEIQKVTDAPIIEGGLTLDIRQMDLPL